MPYIITYIAYTLAHDTTYYTWDRSNGSPDQPNAM